MKIKPLPPPGPSLESEVYRRLRDLIVSGELAPGALYSMNELATQLRVSRTPVSQAVARLADQGMIRVEHRRGMRVLETSSHDLAEIYQIRLLLEPQATHRATGLMRAADHRRLKQALAMLGEVDAMAVNPREYVRRDAEFHRVILQSSGNRRLAEYVQTLRDLQTIRDLSTVDRTRPLRDVIADHERIYELIIARDADGAAREMNRHIAVTYELLVAQETGDSTTTVRPPWPENNSWSH
ncbi:MAG: GntR family transcriptional regulator [Solirubrobacteraceae bacterium]